MRAHIGRRKERTPRVRVQARGRAPLPSLGPDSRVDPVAAQQRPARIPLATYRLQFNREFTFRHALETAAYLRELGVSDVYASPFFRAGPQSTHGYDVCGFDQLNPHLGGTAEFEALATRLRELGMGLLVDMAPNHMGTDLSNCWWVDVLERGQDSRFATWFDVEWSPVRPGAQGKVLLPILEDHYVTVLEAGRLCVVFSDGGLALAYHDRKFPLSPSSYRALVKWLTAGERQNMVLAPSLVPMRSGGEWDSDGGTAASRKAHQTLRASYESSTETRRRVDARLRELNGTPGAPRSFDSLDALIRRQHYQLVFWRAGLEEINYRRFFDVPELVSLRMESPVVFVQTHRLLFRLIQEGKITGLRIDHPDGLWNPKQYFERLQLGATDALAPQAMGTPRSRGSNALPPEGGVPALYVVAEKILSGDEPLPEDWPVAGTTGYDFLNQLNGIFIDHRAAEQFDALYRQFTGFQGDFPAAVDTGKMLVLQRSFVSELDQLTSGLKALGSQTRLGWDLTTRRLQAALAEVIAAFPLYRTYLTEETQQVSASDRASILEAVDLVRARNPSLDPVALDFIKSVLLLEIAEAGNDDLIWELRRWIMKFQQLTGPVMAKGVEDTAFYNYNRLVSLNEVGGDPGRFGQDLDAFHAYNRMKASRWPHSLLATATHDTKRGEDLRARLNVLSEMPQEWREAISRWQQLNADKKSPWKGSLAPHPNDEYLFYQSLLGAWTPEAETSAGLDQLEKRLQTYMLKAIREAKARTSWTSPDFDYEQAVAQFVSAVLSGPSSSVFLDDFRPFQRRVAFFGAFNSLSQVLLKMTSPGVPDLYQGTELWDFNLVDPDNRRPVDYSLRRRLLAGIKERVASEAEDWRLFIAELIQDAASGRIKLYVLWRALQLRHTYRDLFTYGSYEPLAARGSESDHVCAFSRSFTDQHAIILAPRLVVGLTRNRERPPIGPAVWQGTVVELPETNPGESYYQVFTGEKLRGKHGKLALAEAFSTFPLALLIPEQTPKGGY